MPHDLIDNQNIKLVDIIKQTLPGSAFCRRLFLSPRRLPPAGSGAARPGRHDLSQWLDAKAYLAGYGPIFNAAGNPLSRPEKGVAIAALRSSAIEPELWRQRDGRENGSRRERHGPYRGITQNDYSHRPLS